jgi:hypothetical protein
LAICENEAMHDDPTVPQPHRASALPSHPGAATGPFSPPATPSTSDPTALPAGVLVGKYQIIETIGSGGMGFVYLALNPDLKHPVALKILRGGEFAQPEDLRRFALECETLARLRHPHIVAVHDAGVHQGRPFLVMEYLSGGSLAKNRARFHDDPRAAVALIEKVARAVQVLHTGGMLHRDLKPANVLLDEAGEPHVGDFGLIKLLEHGDDLTRTGQCPGTPPYMAPEQTEQLAGPLGPPTDVWALGVMLYELLLGQRPFLGNERLTLFREIATCEPIRPRSLRPDLDANLEAVVLRCLHKNPAQRFATAGDLADDLARWLRGEPTHTRPEGRLHRLRRALRSRPRLSATLLLLGIVLALTPVVAYFRDPKRQERQIQGQLARGQAATLIGDKGRPAYQRWAIENDAQAAVDNEGMFVLHARNLGLLELLGEVPISPYRFRAKVRHDQSDLDGRVGVFVGHHAASTSPRGLRLFTPFSFNDAIIQSAFVKLRNPKLPPLPGNIADLRYWLFAENAADDWPPINRPVFFQPTGRNPPEGQERPWYSLVMDVWPDRIEALFGKDRLEKFTFEAANRKLDDQVRALLAHDPVKHGLVAGLDFRVDASGSLGLFVYRGSASFCDVVIEPIP